MAEYDANAAGTNPWRPLPDDPVILHVIKEAIFIKDVISNMMLPTSLPDDDLGIVSEYLRNLETRRDITPLVFRESGIKDTVTSVSIRRDRIPVLQEPYDLRARFQALGRYWTDFRGPQEWEPAFDTTSVPPLIPLPDGERPPSITVDPEEQEHVDEDFDHYLRERRIKVEYYSQHPPRPMAFLPAPGVNSRDALGALHPEKELEAGLRSSGGQIQATQMFVPMYPSPNLQSLPIMPVSDDPERANARIARTQRLNRMYEIRSERRKAQKEYYAKLVEKTEEARREKRRLQQMEREMQNASV